jgi:hypothetical protein
MEEGNTGIFASDFVSFFFFEHSDFVSYLGIQFLH